MTTIAVRIIDQPYRFIKGEAINEKTFKNSPKRILRFKDGSRITFKDGEKYAYGKSPSLLAVRPDGDKMTKSIEEVNAQYVEEKAKTNFETKPFVVNKPTW